MFMALQDDALVRAMMPFPKPDAGIFFIKESPKLVDYAVMLSRMSSPINPTVMPVWSFTDPRELLEILGETNVQPLVLHGAADKDIELLRKIAQPASIKPRKLIVAGSADLVPPSVYRRIETELTTDKYSFNELNVLPWESLGATAIRKWMRKEWVSEVRCTRTQGDTRDE
ncbi:MAG: hypothetical protein JO208_12755 [Alphaproteobacteria bacterium]|nr:hypothetical protein [Alphaproteobacteria bacterium]